MRTIFRLCLVVALVAAVGVVAVPTAQAKAGAIGQVSITNFEKKQNKKIRKARRKAKKAHTRIEALKGWNLDQDGALGEHGDLLDQIVTGALEIIAGLQALQAALEDDVAPALEAIDDALNDETTGLVGLNLARPPFGAFEADGTLIGATGASGGMGPDDDAVQGPAAAPVVGDIDGVYVVDFNNDVSSRMYTVNVFPLGPTGAGGGAAPTASAVNCASATSVADLCGLVQLSSGGTGASDPDPDKVLVQIGDGTDGAGDAPNGFSVTALSG